MRRRAILSLSAVVVLAACNMQAGPNQPQPTTVIAPDSNGAAAQVETLRTKVEGAVKLPSSMVAAGSMNMVAAGSMNLVAAGGMNLVSVGSGALVSVGSGALVSVGTGSMIAAGGMNYRLAAIEQTAIENVTVFLCDALGKPIPGLPPVVTDANGKFSIPDVPAGFTLVTNAVVEYKNGKRGNLATLVHTGDPAGSDIDAGTTLTAIRAAAGHEGRDLGYFDAKVYKRAVDAANAALTEPTSPDWLDLTTVAKRAAAFDTDIKDFREALKLLRPQLGTQVTSVDAFIQTLAKPTPTPGPTATPTPRPTLAPTPTPGPTATPYRDPALEVCGPYVRHTFRPNITGGTRLVFRIRKPSDRDRQNWPVAVVAPLVEGNVTVPVELPEGCAFRVELQNATATLAANDNWEFPATKTEQVDVSLN